MHLKDFLSEPFNKQHFIEFISERFYGFAKNLKQSEYLGKVKLDDKNEIGFFIFEVDENKDIENTRSTLNQNAQKVVNDHFLDGAIVAFYNAKTPWRLSYIRFGEKDKKQHKRYTYVLGNSKTKTAEKQLVATKYQKLSDIENAFSIEAVTKEFYKGLVKEYEKLLSEYLIYPSNDDNSKKEFAIRLIGRILFIKFLNKKSLVPDDIFEVADGYYHEKLEPLFFEQLNTPKSERKAEFINDSIPFLNGGLFEPLHLDYYEWSGICSKYINMLKIDDRFFSELYEHLNHYNFTIDENSTEDSELSIDPEMLGRIFENLLAEINPETSGNARKSTGSYYTPREIVDYMVSSSLLEYLRTKTSVGEESLKTIIFKNEEPKNDYDKAKVLSALFELKILDPACGSGAFPMGLLQKIVKILNLIDADASIWFGLQNKEFRQTHKDRNKDYIRKLSIIKNTIYGIDIQPIAIEISKLRFFLSLIVDEDGEPEPLPNLEFKFVCANSLLPKTKNTQLASLEYFMFENDLINLKNEYFEASGDRKKEIRKEYIEVQKKMFEEEEATNLLSALDNNLTNYNPFNPTSVAGFFDSDFMFNIKEGFDIVIGNPPYLGEKGNKETFAPLKKLKYYQGKMDLFYFFFHLGLDNLKNGGVLSLITTNYYVTATGAIKLRNDFKERSTVLNLINFNELKIFESALGQHNLITTLQKGKFDKPAQTSIVNVKGYLGTEILQSIVEGKNKDTNYYKIPQDKLFNGGNIQLTMGGIDDILDSVAIKSDLLGNITNVRQGLRTGADYVTKKHLTDYNFNGNIGDGIFIISKKLNIDIESSILKNWYKNSDIGKYITNLNTEECVIFSEKDNTEIEFKNKFPKVYKHLFIFKNLLEKIRERNQERVDYWFTLDRTRDSEMFEIEKIVAPQRSYYNTFAYSDSSFHASADVYFITKSKKPYSLKFLLAILNSKLIYKWLYYRGKRKGEMLELYQEPLSKIPIIKDVSKVEQQLFIDLVDKIMELKEKNEETKELENQIDEMVYELYGLSEDEIKVVEGRE